MVGWPRERCEERKHPKADFRGNVDFKGRRDEKSEDEIDNDDLSSWKWKK